MIKSLTRYFHGVTLENWGFPWHLFLSAWGTALSIGVLYIRLEDYVAFPVGFVLVQVIGFIYDRRQVAKIKAEHPSNTELFLALQRDTKQDLLANLFAGFAMMATLILFTSAG